VLYSILVIRRKHILGQIYLIQISVPDLLLLLVFLGVETAGNCDGKRIGRVGRPLCHVDYAREAPDLEDEVVWVVRLGVVLLNHAETVHVYGQVVDTHHEVVARAT
jgi:hypothetical protein